MLQHNSYFEGNVQSIGFERNGRRYTAGVFEAGAFHFNTDSAERMTVISGALSVKPDGSNDWALYPAGTAFEIGGRSGFDVRATEPCAYLCEFL